MSSSKWPPRPWRRTLVRDSRRPKPSGSLSQQFTTCCDIRWIWPRPEYDSRQIRVNPLSASSLLADHDRSNWTAGGRSRHPMASRILPFPFITRAFVFHYVTHPSAVSDWWCQPQSGARTWNLIETTNKTPLRDFSATGPKERKTTRVGCRISRFLS